MIRTTIFHRIIQIFSLTIVSNRVNLMTITHHLKTHIIIIYIITIKIQHLKQITFSQTIISRQSINSIKIMGKEIINKKSSNLSTTDHQIILQSIVTIIIMETCKTNNLDKIILNKSQTLTQDPIIWIICKLILNLGIKWSILLIQQEIHLKDKNSDKNWMLICILKKANLLICIQILYKTKYKKSNLKWKSSNKWSMTDHNLRVDNMPRWWWTLLTTK